MPDGLVKRMIMLTSLESPITVSCEALTIDADDLARQDFTHAVIHCMAWSFDHLQDLTQPVGPYGTGHKRVG